MRELAIDFVAVPPSDTWGFLGGTVHLESSGSGDTRQLQVMTDEGSPHLGHNWTDADRKWLAILMQHVLLDFVQGEQQRGRGALQGAHGEALGPVAGLGYSHHLGNSTKEASSGTLLLPGSWRRSKAFSAGRLGCEKWTNSTTELVTRVPWRYAKLLLS